MEKLNSTDGFAACDKQARISLGDYLKYRLGPQLQVVQTLSQQEIVLLVACIFATIAYCFTVQAEVYVGMAIMLEILGEKGWLAGVLGIVGAGLVSSFLWSEVIPYTRLLTKTTPEIAPDRMQTLVGEVLGIKNREGYRQNRLAFFTFGYTAVMLAFVIYLAVQGVKDAGNSGAVFFAPLLFLLDSLLGVGPFWLLVFGINRVRTYGQNRETRANYIRMEESWNLTRELYDIAQTWYFQEHPELNHRPELLPPVSPLAGFIITHLCHEDIEIPKYIINPPDEPSDPDEPTDPAAPPPPDEPPSGNGGTPPASSEPDASLDEPADVFSAMDTKSEANDITV